MIDSGARMEMIRILIFAALFAIVASLGTALYHLSSGKHDSKKMVRALTVRIVLSLVLFFLIMAAWWFGLITPHAYQQ
jgi:hypothetical protein